MPKQSKIDKHSAATTTTKTVSKKTINNNNPSSDKIHKKKSKKNREERRHEKKSKDLTKKKHHHHKSSSSNKKEKTIVVAEKLCSTKGCYNPRRPRPVRPNDGRKQGYYARCEECNNACHLKMAFNQAKKASVEMKKQQQQQLDLNGNPVIVIVKGAKPLDGWAEPNLKASPSSEQKGWVDNTNSTTATLTTSSSSSESGSVSSPSTMLDSAQQQQQHRSEDIEEEEEISQYSTEGTGRDYLTEVLSALDLIKYVPLFDGHEFNKHSFRLLNEELLRKDWRPDGTSIEHFTLYKESIKKPPYYHYLFFIRA